MNLVIDTGVLLKMAGAGIHSPLFVAWQAHRFDLYLSHEMLSELEDVLSRPHIQKFVALLDLRGLTPYMGVKQRAHNLSYPARAAETMCQSS